MPAEAASGPTAAPTADEGMASSVVPAVYQASGDGRTGHGRAETDHAAGADALAHGARRVAGARPSSAPSTTANTRGWAAPASTICSPVRGCTQRDLARASSASASGQVTQRRRAQRRQAARHVPLHPALAPAAAATAQRRRPSQPAST